MSNWIVNKLVPLNRRNLELLLEHKVPGLIVENFVSDSVCELIDKRLYESAFQNYDHLSDIPVHHLGLCHNQWANDVKDEYFKRVPAATKEVTDLLSGTGIDTVACVMQAFRIEAGVDAEIFEEPGYGRYFAGAFRSFKGHGKLHVDHAPTHIEKEWAVKQIKHQMTWNVYYSLHNDPGELIIYDTIHTPENEIRKTPGDYYFPYDVLESDAHVRITPKTGTLVIFNTQNFHEILGHKAGTRISQTSFIGVPEAGTLRFWS